MAAIPATAISNMHHDIEVTTRRLELEKRRLQRLEKELATARRTYELKTRQRSARGRPAPSTSAERGRSLGSRGLPPEESVPSKTLANRLDVQLKKLDGIKHENAALRSEIDAIRRQRMQLNSIFERLRVDIRQRSAQLADFIEETEASRGVHDDAKLRVAVMQRQRETDRTGFKAQVMKLRKDLQNTDHERKEIEVQLMRATEGVQKKKELIVPREEHGFSEACMMRRIMKAAFLNCIQRRHIKQHQRNIEVFEQAFATIKQSTGISNIEEIVRIFINLESRNFSLLTYVNHMNREIEVLEGTQRWRSGLQAARRSNEEESEQQREQALADLKKQLQATSNVSAEDRESCSEHRQIVKGIAPSIMQISQRIHREIDDMKKAQGAAPMDDLPRLPPDLREETLPEWLDWVENALGRFRDAVPQTDSAETAFPPTASALVKQLAPKRLHRHVVGNPQLVKPQDLPSAVTLNPDDPSLSAQKRAHASGLSATQKADLLDEDSEEEDFERMPLALKDIRSRAQLALAKKRRRNVNFRQGDMLRTEELGGTGTTTTTATPSRGPSRAAVHTPGRASPQSDAAPTPRRSSSQALGEATPASEVPAKDDEEDSGREGSPGSRVEGGGAGAEEASNSSSAQAPAGGEGARGDSAGGRSATASPEKASEPSRTCRALQAQIFERVASASALGHEISEEELELLFLKRYKMTRDELELIASRMGIHLSNLCYVKQEFDLYDEDRSGCIDAGELRSLLGKLGEEPSAQELEAVLARLDADGTGEVEFFEFCSWFSSSQ